MHNTAVLERGTERCVKSAAGHVRVTCEEREESAGPWASRHNAGWVGPPWLVRECARAGCWLLGSDGLLLGLVMIGEVYLNQVGVVGDILRGFWDSWVGHVMMAFWIGCSWAVEIGLSEQHILARYGLIYGPRLRFPHSKHALILWKMHLNNQKIR